MIDVLQRIKDAGGQLPSVSQLVNEKSDYELMASIIAVESNKDDLSTAAICAT